MPDPLTLGAVAVAAPLLLPSTRPSAADASRDRHRADTGEAGEPPIVRDLAALHPEAQARAHRWLIACDRAGYVVRITETARTTTRQEWLRARGRSTVSIGYHQTHLALDYMVERTPSGLVVPYGALEPAEEAALRDVAQLAATEGWRWGGAWTNFRDLFHLELRVRGATAAQLAELAARYGPAYTLPGPIA